MAEMMNIAKEENVNGEIVLCPNCMTGNSPVRDFCKSCGCPIGQFVNVDPLKRIYSQGWLYRKAVSEAVSGHITPIVFWGMCLIFGSTFLNALAALLLADSYGGLGEPRSLINVFYLVISGVIFFRVTKNYL
ncbi:MAG: hypothetical protein QME81_01845 [bacterium]|nr:hypothetical protein [bacterium]